MPTSSDPKVIRAKRRASTQGAIRKKVEEGTATGDERAVIRVGKANTRIMTGQDDLSEWDDEELRRGFRKDKNGQFKGRPPKVIPKAIHDELVRRTISKAQIKMRDSLEKAVDILASIAEDTAAEDKDRLKAVGMIMDRVMGKDPVPVDLKTDTPPWQMAIQAGIVTIKNADLLGSDEMDDDETPD